jgi:hypothetical protein
MSRESNKSKWFAGTTVFLLLTSFFGGIVFVAVALDDKDLAIATGGVFCVCLVGAGFLLRRYLSLSKKELASSIGSAAFILVLLSSLPLYVIWKIRSEIQTWEFIHREGEILGKSPRELTAKYGQPDSFFRDANESIDVMVYTGPHLRICRIELREGVAVKALTGMK